MSNHNLFKSYSPLIIISAIFLVQSFFFNDKRITVDEVWHSVTAYQSIENGGFKVNSIHHSSGIQKLDHLAVFESLLVGWHFVFPKEIEYSRLLTTFLSLLLIILTYHFTLKIFNSWIAAVFASSILAFDNLFFIVSNAVRSDAILALSLVFILILIFDKNGNTRNKYFLIAAGIFTVISFGLHPNFILIYPALFIVLIIFKNKSNGYRDSALSALHYLSGGMVIIFISIFLMHTKGMFDQYGILNYLTSYMHAGFTFNLAGIASEIERYQDFMQIPYRVHIVLMILVSWIFAFRSKIKIIRIVALLALIISVEMIFLKNKNVRYLSILLPLYSIMTANLLYSLYIAVKEKRIVLAAAFVLIAISITGNIYFTVKNQNANYEVFKSNFEAADFEGKPVLGPLILWDIFRNSKYISFHSHQPEIVKIPFDFVIVQEQNPSEEFVTTKSSIYSDHKFQNRIKSGMKSLEANLIDANAELIREIKNVFYGTFRIYRLPYTQLIEL